MRIDKRKVVCGCGQIRERWCVDAESILNNRLVEEEWDWLLADGLCWHHGISE